MKGRGAWASTILEVFLQNYASANQKVTDLQTLNMAKTAPFLDRIGQFSAKLWYYQTAKPWVK